MDSSPDTTTAAAAPADAAEPLTHSLKNWHEPELANLHAQVFTLFGGAYVAMLLAFWVFFGTEINVLISLGIATVYFVVYFGVPFAMNRLAAKAEPRPQGAFARFLDAEVDTYTGPVSARGAIVQILTVPVVITAAVITVGIYMRFIA